MTNAERYLSTLSLTAQKIADEADFAGKSALHSVRKGRDEDALCSSEMASHHALGLPPHVLSALAAAIRIDRSAS